MWSLTSQRVRRTSGLENFQSSAKKHSFNTIDPNQTSISTLKRDTLRSRWVSNRTGESRNDGAKKCSEVGYWRDHMRRRGKLCQSSLFKGCDASLLVVGRPNGQKRQPTLSACDESGEAE